MATKNSIQVGIKVRPLLRKEQNQNSSWRIKENSIQLAESQSEPYYFDYIFDQEASNQQIFDTMAKHIIHSGIQGINGTIFAYGQTSSGKTYTMMGDENNPGVMVLAAKEIFNEIENEPDRQFLLRVGYIEIYNEKIYDLLNKKNQDLKIHETAGIVNVNCEENIVTSQETLLSFLNVGNNQRTVGETNMNERSSRSHAIFRIIIESRKMDRSEDDTVTQSVLNLVDLAGSERADQTGARGTRLKEGGHINKSLLFLSNVIKNLSENEDHKFISYRDSKLTRILQASLGGNALTSIICTIKPTAVEETQSTLSFALRAKTIKNKPQVNETVSDATMMKRLEREIKDLKSRLEEERSRNENQIKVGELEKRIKQQVLKIISSNSLRNVREITRRRTWCTAMSIDKANTSTEITTGIPIPKVMPISRLKAPTHVTLRTLKPPASARCTRTCLNEDINEIEDEKFVDAEKFPFRKVSPTFETSSSQEPQTPVDKSRGNVPDTPRLSQNPELRIRLVEESLNALQEYTDLEQQYNVDHDLYDGLKRHLEELSNRNEVLEKERLDFLQIKEDLSEAKQQANSSEIRCLDLECQVKELNDSKNAAKSQIQKLEQINSDLQSKIKDLEIENREAVSLEFEFQRHKKRSNLREDELLSVVSDKEEQIQKLEKTINDIRRDQLAAVNRKSVLPTGVAHSLENQEEILSENQRLITVLEKLEYEHEQLKVHYELAMNDATLAKQQLSEVERSNISECNILRDEISVIREKLHDVEQEYTQLSTENSAKAAACEEQKLLNEKLKNEMQLLQDKSEELTMAWQEQQLTINNIQQEYDSIQHKYHELQTEYEKLESTSVQSMGDCARLQKENETLQMEIENLKMRMKSVQQQMLDTECSSEKTVEEIALAQNNAKLKEEVQELEAKYNELQLEYDTLSNELMDNLHECDNLREKYQNLEAELKSKTDCDTIKNHVVNGHSNNMCNSNGSISADMESLRSSGISMDKHVISDSNTEMLNKFLQLIESLHEIELELKSGKSCTFTAKHITDIKGIVPTKLHLSNCLDIAAIDLNESITTLDKLCMQGVFKQYLFHIVELEQTIMENAVVESDIQCAKYDVQELKRQIEELSEKNEMLRVENQQLLNSEEHSIKEMREKIMHLSTQLFEKSMFIDNCACEDYQKQIENLIKERNEISMLCETLQEKVNLTVCNATMVSANGTLTEINETLCMSGIFNDVDKMHESSIFQNSILEPTNIKNEVETELKLKVKTEVEECEEIVPFSEPSVELENQFETLNLQQAAQLKSMQKDLEAVKKQLAEREEQFKHLELEFYQKLEENEAESRNNLRKHHEWEESKNNLENIIETLRAQLESREAMRNDLENELDVKCKELRTAEDMIVKIRIELQENYKEFEEKSKSFDECLAQIKNLETENAWLQQQRTNFEENLDGAQVVADLTKKLSDSQIFQKDLTQKLKQMQEVHEELKEKHKLAKQESEVLTSELCISNQECVDLAKHLFMAKQENEDCAKQLSSSKQECEDLSELLRVSKQEYEDSIKLLNVYKQKLEDVLEQLRAAEQDFKDIKEQIDDKEKYENQTKQLNVYKEKCEDLSKQLSENNEQFEDLTEKLSAFKLQNEGLTKQLNASNKETEDLAKQLSASKEEAEDLIKQLSASKQETEDLIKQLSASKLTTEDFIKKFSESKQETEDLTKQLSAAEVETEELTNQLSASKKETEDLAKQLSASKKETEDLANQLSAFKQEMEDLTKQLSASKQETAVLLKQLETANQVTDEDLTKQLSASKQEYEVVLKQLGAAKKEYENFRNQIDITQCKQQDPSKKPDENEEDPENTQKARNESQKDFANLTIRLTELEAQLEDANKKFAETQNHNEVLTKLLSETQKVPCDFTAKRSDIEKECEAQNGKKTTGVHLKVENDENELQEESLKQKFNQANIEIANLKMQYNLSEDEREDLKNKLYEAHERQNILSKQLKEAQELQENMLQNGTEKLQPEFNFFDNQNNLKEFGEISVENNLIESELEEHKIRINQLNLQLEEHMTEYLSLQVEKDNIETKFSELKESLTILEAEKSSFKAHNKVLNDEKTEAECQLNELKNSYANLKVENDSLRAEIDCVAELKMSLNQLNEMNAKLKVVQEEKEIITVELTALKESFAKSVEQKCMWQSKVEELQNEKSKIEVQLAEVNSNTIQLESEIASLQTEKQNIEKELRTLKESNVKLQEQKTTLLMKVDSLESVNDSLAEYKALKESYALLEAEKSNIDSKCETLEAQLLHVNALQTHLTSAQSQLEIAHKTVLEENATLKEQKKALADKKNLLESELRKLSTTNESLMKLNDDLNTNLSKISEEKRKMEESLIDLKNNNISLEELLDSLKNELKSYKKIKEEHKRHKDSMEALLSEKVKLQNELVEVLEQKQKLQAELQAAQQQVEQNNVKLQDQMKVCDQIVQDRDKLKTSIEQLKNGNNDSFQNLLTQLAESKSENEMLKANEKGLCLELETIKQELQDLKKTSFELKNQLDKANDENEKNKLELQQVLSNASRTATSFKDNQQSIETLQKTLYEKSIQLKSYVKDNINLQRDNEQLQNVLDKVQANYNNLQTAMQEMSTEWEAHIKKGSKTSSAECEQLKITLTKLSAENDELQQRLKETEHLKISNKALEAGLAEQKKLMQEQKDAYTNLRTLLNSKEQTHKNDKQKLEGTISCLLTEKKNLEDKLLATEELFKKMEPDFRHKNPQSPDYSIDLNISTSPRGRRSLDFSGNANADGKSVQQKSLFSEAERKNRRLSAHDERRRQSYWGASRDVHTMTDPTDSNCKCVELDSKLQECERNLFIRESQVSALNIELKSHPLKAENAALKKRLQEEQENNRNEIRKYKQIIVDQKTSSVLTAAAKAEAARNAVSPAKVMINVDTQTESEMEGEIQKLMGKYNDLKNICRYRYNVIKELNAKLEQKENDCGNVPISALEAGQIKALKTRCEAMERELTKYRNKYEEAKKILHSRQQEITIMRQQLGQSN